ncbi:MAG: dihydroneopterin aldolase [Prevotella sp.]
MKTSIFINDIRFHAHHGVMPQERVVGADFTVSVRLGYDFSLAASTDDVADTISYADVYELLRDEMAIASKLLEHVAGRMVDSLRSRFPAIHSIDLSLTKLNPPMGADCSGAGVEIHWTSLNNDKTLA